MSPLRAKDFSSESIACFHESLCGELRAPLSVFGSAEITAINAIAISPMASSSSSGFMHISLAGGVLYLVDILTFS